MTVVTNEKLIAWLALVSGLSISAVAVYYSVAGLVSIFAAAAIPIIIMGIVLELSKLVATVWLKQNWTRAPRGLKWYMSSAVIVLMIITSMGIFGFLSKAHLDQSVPTGDIADKVAVIDEKIATERENINAARKALTQMDASVNETLSRSTSEQGADKATAIRRSQAKERNVLQNEISQAQKRIAVLNDERAPIAKELRAVEAEVGPIKYIAKLVYGDNPDANLLEKAVTWVILIIVSVFDPLAVILLLASQLSFQWVRDRDKTPDVSPPPTNNEIITEPVTITQVDDEAERAAEANALVAELEKEPETEVFEEPVDEIVKDAGGIEAWNKLLAEAERAVEEEKQETISEKEARRKFKETHPGETIKKYEKLRQAGAIDHLPWEDSTSLERPGDYLTEPAEVQDDSKKKSYIVKEHNQQIRKEKN